MLIKKCPVCGSCIVFVERQVIDYVYGVSHQTGKILRSTRSRSKEVHKEVMIRCSNKDCHASWSASDFFVNLEDRIVDEKYTQNES